MILFAVAKYVILFLCATLFVWFALFFLEETPTSTAGERERETEIKKERDAWVHNFRGPAILELARILWYGRYPL